jgi:predicted site-specific integrase-resolvase
MESIGNKRFLSGKACQEIIDVSHNTLRRWDNEGKIITFRRTPNGKRYYDINSILELCGYSNNLISKNKSTNTGLRKAISYPNILKQISYINHQDEFIKNNNISINSLNNTELNVLHPPNIISKVYKLNNNVLFNSFKQKRNKKTGEMENELKKNTITKDDSYINYSYFQNKQKCWNNIKPPSIICYCKVNNNQQQHLLNAQINKLQILYPDAIIISGISPNNSNWKKNNILIILKHLQKNFIKKLIINNTSFIAKDLITLFTSICEIYNVEIELLN